MPEIEAVKEAKDKNKEEILAHPNVVGVGTGYKITGGEMTDQVVIVTMVREKLPISALSEEDIIPRHLDGVQTDVIEVGDLRAFQSRTDRWRPAPAGVSLGHFRITAGTFGCIVRDRGNGEALILSNNHVLANENDARIDDPILQPGPADGGRMPKDIIASLLRFIPLHFEGEPETNSCLPLQAIADTTRKLGLQSLANSLVREAVPAVNLVDAAVARPVEGLFTGEILDIGAVSGSVQASLGMQVRKSGRSTQTTSGQIQIIDSTVQVAYSGMRVARFENQILSSAMSLGGDSGSLLVAEGAPLAVGLLFGGSEVVTIYNPIEIVLDMLGVQL